MSRTFSARSLRNLEGVHPDLRKVIEASLQSAPYDFIVIEGVRSVQRQKELVAAGASQTMDSRHITGHAVDLLPIGPNGPRFDWPLYNRLGPHIKQVAEQMGVDLEWGGDWTSFKDGPHFQLSRSAYPAEEWVTGQEPPKPRVTANRNVQASGVLGGAAALLPGLGWVADMEWQQLAVIGGFALVALVVAGVVFREELRWMRAGEPGAE